MTSSAPARRTIHRTRIRWPRVAGLLALVAAIAAALGSQSPSPGPSSSTASPPSKASPPSTAAAPVDVHRAPRDRAGGAVPDGATVFDDEIAGVANLDADLLAALRRAAADAEYDGVELVVNSGWRPPEHQERLLDEAVAKYGSQEEAARWVATPETSPHVSGDAVDIGPSDARAWLSEQGAEYGLCQIYANEPWHFELRPEARDQGCPPLYADPTHDPRMQQ